MSYCEGYGETRSCRFPSTCWRCRVCAYAVIWNQPSQSLHYLSCLSPCSLVTHLGMEVFGSTEHQSIVLLLLPLNVLPDRYAKDDYALPSNWKLETLESYDPGQYFLSVCYNTRASMILSYCWNFRTLLAWIDGIPRDFQHTFCEATPYCILVQHRPGSIRIKLHAMPHSPLFEVVSSVPGFRVHIALTLD